MLFLNQQLSLLSLLALSSLPPYFQKFMGQAAINMGQNAKNMGNMGHPRHVSYNHQPTPITTSFKQVVFVSIITRSIHSKRTSTQ